MTRLRRIAVSVAGRTLLSLALLAPLHAVAQEVPASTTENNQQPLVVVQSAILTVESEQLFLGSAYGKRVMREIQEASVALAEENRTIEAELTAEELELTQKRAELSAEEFRPLAEAFDEKAQRIRAEQTAKANEIRNRPEQARLEFLRLSQGVLVQIMRDNRALAIIERSSLLLFADAIDITEFAISRIDAVIGDGLGTGNQ